MKVLKAIGNYVCLKKNGYICETYDNLEDSIISKYPIVIFSKNINGHYSAKTFAIAWVTWAQRLAAAASKVG